MGYNIVALPVVAGLALVAKRVKGQTSPGVVLGIFAATLWTGWFATDWLFPNISQNLIPRGLSSLLSVLLFFSTLSDWSVQAVNSRFRPVFSDALVLLLIIAVPVTGYAYLKVDTPPFCTEESSALSE
jgi:hypothetical protein